MTDYKEGLLQETREELAKADAKASILLAASGIIVAALLAADKAPWYPTRLKHAEVLGWVAVALMIAGVVFIAAAVKPRLRAKRPLPGVPHYFADVEAYWPRWWQRWHREQLLASGKRDFAAALRSMPAVEGDARLDDQLWNLSHTAYRKYRLVSIGMWLFAVAVVLALVALIVEKQWL